MSRKLRILICCALVLVAFGAGLLAYAQVNTNRENRANAEGTTPSYLVDKDGKIAGPSKDTSFARGTEENPFFILEVAPYDGIGVVGYWVSGQEPMDIDAFARDRALSLPGGAENLYNVTAKTFYFWDSEKPEHFLNTYGDDAKINQYGNMTRVEDGTGTYARVETPNPDGSGAIVVSYVEQANGDYTWEPLTAEECVTMPYGETTAYEAVTAVTQTADTVGESMKLYIPEVKYVGRQGNVLEHKNEFLREGIGLAYEFDEDGKRHAITEPALVQQKIDNYHVEVYTVTPEDLNLNAELVDRADLIVFSCKPESGTGIYTYVPDGESMYDGDGKIKSDYEYIPYLRDGKYGYEEPDGTYGRVENVKGATFATNRVDWDVVVKMYENSTDPIAPCPIITDYNKMLGGLLTTDNKTVTQIRKSANGKVNKIDINGTANNLVKLFLMSYQIPNPTFEAVYGELGDAENPMFGKQHMKDNEGNDLYNKDGTPLYTGTFLYDNGAARTSKEKDSRVYWCYETLLPWKLIEVSTANELENPGVYASKLEPYKIMVQGGSGATDYAMVDSNAVRAGFLAINTDGNKVTQGFHRDDCGIKDGAYGSDLHDYFDRITDASTRPNPITMVDCVNYLLNETPGAWVNNMEYHILELQPSPDYEDEDSFWKMFLAMNLNSVKDPVVEHMTTSEFIGSTVDCISAYDMVYVGMNKMSSDLTMDFSKFKPKSDDYNKEDPERQYTTNYVYAHTGPKVDMAKSLYTTPDTSRYFNAQHDFYAFYGWLGSLEENRERFFAFSGNDLTLRAYNKLLQFSAAGYPILFADEYYTDTAATTVASTVDRNSYIYKLGTGTGAAVNRIYMGAVAGNVNNAASKLKQLLMTDYKKVEMVFSEMPIIYNSANAEASRYVNGSNIDNRTLTYKFEVKAPAGTKYKVKLYVDSNTDGIFEAGTEDVGVTVYKTNNSGGRGDSISNGVVEAGKTYIVQRTILNRIGSISWKLALVPESGSEDKVFASYSAVSAFKAKPEEKKHIRVLQIIPTDGNTSLSLPTNAEIAAGLSGPSRVFYEKIRDLNDMSISFEHMKQDEIRKKLEGYTEFGVTYPADPEFLYNNFDMLVLGFADSYKGVSDSDVLDAIDEFIEYGKAVLYTHDVSSGIGTAGSPYPITGKNITERFRGLFGMDRYGAMQNIGGTVEGVVDDPYLTTNDSSKIDLLYTNSLTGSDQKELRQGLANGVIYRILYEYINKRTEWNEVEAERVTRVNRGAITEYPYTIAESIPIATTHQQYYQLNMEDEDIVVWYCLAGNVGDTTSFKGKFYNATPNDVRNNYYIYNKGNITYTGMGHNTGLGEAEIELFVNTFVAAYRAAANPVAVEILNDDVTSNSLGKQFLCVDVDSSEPDDIIGTDILDTYYVQNANRDAEGNVTEYVKVNTPQTLKSKRIYFRLHNNNSYGDATYDLKIVWNGGALTEWKLNDSDPANNVSVQINGEEDGKMLAVYRRSDNEFVDENTVEYKALPSSNEEYYVDVPITMEDTLTGQAVATTNLTITVTMNYSIGAREFSVSGDTEVSIMPRGLFNLD